MMTVNFNISGGDRLNLATDGVLNESAPSPIEMDMDEANTSETDSAIPAPQLFDQANSNTTDSFVAPTPLDFEAASESFTDQTDPMPETGFDLALEEESSGLDPEPDEQLEEETTATKKATKTRRSSTKK